MKKNVSIITILLIALFIPRTYADKIYIMNATGYNSAESQLTSVMTAIGHTVVLQTNNLTTLPVGFTSVCDNPATGFDWLCFFGNMDYSGLLTQVKAFIDVGGKVYYQYEVGCCTNASSGVATLLSGLTGLTITENSNSSIAGSSAGNLAGWDNFVNTSCITIIGNAYKGLDGVPSQNQFNATNTLNGATPAIIACTNFGFHFETNDFTGTANNGAITGMGDYNAWMNAGEPFANSGTLPIDTDLVRYFFPVNAEDCSVFPPGCVLENTTNIFESNKSKSKINIYPNPVSSTFKIHGIFGLSSIQIMDLAGKVILNKTVSEDELVDVSSFAQGVYILRTGAQTILILKQ